MRDPLLLPLAALSCGIAISRLAPFGAVEAIAAAVCCGLLCGICMRHGARVLAAVCCLLGFAFAGVLVDLAHRPAPPPQLDAEGRDPVILSGCVVQPPALSGERERFVVELE